MNINQFVALSAMLVSFSLSSQKAHITNYNLTASADVNRPVLGQV